MLFVGDDWAEDHHDVEIVDDTGGVLARRRLSNGLAAKSDTADAPCWPRSCGSTAGTTGRWPPTATKVRRSSSPPAPTRAWSGTAPATCCGCGQRCGSSSPLRLQAFPDLDATDALELLRRAPRPRTGGAAEQIDD